MTHSVSTHLRIAIESYDLKIRQFIRGYDEMLDAAVAAVETAGTLRRVVDLGSGTGALSERLLERLIERHPDCVVELWDIDAAMMEQGLKRLARFGKRAFPRKRSFFDPLGETDAVMASLALHHVRELEKKTALYRSIAHDLRPGGVLVNADVTIPAEEPAARQAYRTWADHLVASGIDEEQAFKHFDEWATEDRYFSLDQELEALREAGLEAECSWRKTPSTVICARRKKDEGRSEDARDRRRHGGRGRPDPAHLARPLPGARSPRPPPPHSQ